VNDENAPSRIGVLGKAKTVASENINAKNNAKEVTTLKASAKPRVVLGQQRDTSNLVAGKRKRDALGDATNETKSKVTTLKPSITINSTAKVPAPSHSRASSVSTTVSGPKDKENVTRPRAPLGVKSKNIVPVAPAPSEKEKRPAASSEATSAATKRVVRRPLSAKPAQAPTTTTTTTTNVTVSRTKVTETTVRAEPTKRQVLAHKSQVEKVSKTTKVAKIDLTDVDEDDVRSHKRPRLSDEVEEAVELKNVTVEKVHEALTIAVTKPEDEEPEDLDKDDVDDPLMVAEYVVEIFDYLRALEVILSFFAS
jgi:hypothetical protein